jgi:hypothetical protein
MATSKKQFADLCEKLDFLNATLIGKQEEEKRAIFNFDIHVFCRSSPHRILQSFTSFGKLHFLHRSHVKLAIKKNNNTLLGNFFFSKEDKKFVYHKTVRSISSYLEYLKKRPLYTKVCIHKLYGRSNHDRLRRNAAISSISV